MKLCEIESSSRTSYAVTTEVPGTAAELLARIAVLEPQFAVMRQAFQRPYVRIMGNDQEPQLEPDPRLHLSSISRACWMRRPNVI